MAGSSTFPTSVDNKTALADGIDIIQADDVNNAYVPMTSTQTFIGANGKGASWSTDILDYECNTGAPIIIKASGSTLTVKPGAVAIKNSGQTNRLLRRTTNDITVTSSNLDTGSMADDTYYYVYAVADSAATTFTIKFSASSTSPTGLTNFELIGWFFNESAGALDVTSGFVGNLNKNGRHVPNAVKVTAATDISRNNTSYADMTDMSVRFVATGNRNLRINFEAPMRMQDNSATGAVNITINTTQKTFTVMAGTGSGTQGEVVALPYIELALAAGEYTIAVQWKSSNQEIRQYGSTDGPRLLLVEEV